MIPAVKAYVRPDGRHFVGDPDPEFPAETTTDLYCTVEASEIDSYLALGFGQPSSTAVAPPVR